MQLQQDVLDRQMELEQARQKLEAGEPPTEEVKGKEG